MLHGLMYFHETECFRISSSWKIFKETTVFYILYVEPTIEGMEGQQCVVFPIEDNGHDPHFFAVFTIVGGCHLDPSAIDMQVGKPVAGEDVAPSLFEELSGSEVLPYFREPEPGRDTRGTSQCNEQHRLLDAIALFACEDVARLEVFRSRSW